MNKVSGYTEIRQPDGTVIPLKFGIGAFELFAELIGVTTIEDAQKAIMPEVEENGTFKPTFGYIGRLRKLLFCAAKYACLVENRPVNFNEWHAGAWIDENGIEGVLSAMDMGPKPGEVDEPAAKKKAKGKLKASL